MKNTIRIDLVQGSEAWLAYRKSRVGASDVVSIAEVDGAYKSRTDVLNEKLGLVEPVLTDFQKQLFASGATWEITVRDFLNSQGRSFTPAVYQVADQPCFFASLDGIDPTGDQVLEIKSTKRQDFLESVIGGLVPGIWSYQCQWQMYVCGASSALLACVNSETGAIQTVDIKRDDQMIAFLVDCANQFLADLTSGVRPYQVVENAEMLRIAELKKATKEAQKIIDLYEAEMKATAEGLLHKFKATKIEGYGISVTMQERAGNVDYSQIEALKGIDLDAYRKPSTKFPKITEVKTKKENT